MFATPINQKQPTVDWFLMVAVLALMVVGVSFIYSASMANESSHLFKWYQQFHFKQVIWYAVGAVGCLLLCLIPYHSLTRWSLVYYWITIGLLILVFVVGEAIMGARRWIDLGPFALQPSEFAKLSFIFAQAHFLSRPAEELRTASVFFKSLGLLALPFVLILKEPDLGSALILMPIALVMLFVAGAPKRYLGRLLALFGLVTALVVIDIIFAPPHLRVPMKEYQRHRLLVFFGRDFAPANATREERLQMDKLQRAKSYNIEQALMSVGSGGLMGKGWRQGTQTGLGFLPRAVAHNDFIFSVIAEEKGFVGSVVVITLYLVILFIGIRIAGEARDRLGKLLAVGVVTLLFSHVFINIGMNISLMPVVGVPLPLLSYGGSSVLCSLIAIGILQNVYIYRRSY